MPSHTGGQQLQCSTSWRAPHMSGHPLPQRSRSGSECAARPEWAREQQGVGVPRSRAGSAGRSGVQRSGVLPRQPHLLGRVAVGSHSSEERAVYRVCVVPAADCQPEGGVQRRCRRRAAAVRQRGAFPTGSLQHSFHSSLRALTGSGLAQPRAAGLPGRPGGARGGPSGRAVGLRLDSHRCESRLPLRGVERVCGSCASMGTRTFTCT